MNIWRGRRSIRIRVAGAVGLLAVIVAGGLHARGGEPWTDPEVVLDDGNPIQGIDVAAGPRGYAVVTWTSGRPDIGPNSSGPEPDDRVWVSVRPPGRTSFRAPRPLSAAGGRGSQVVIAPDGRTVITWLGAAGQLRASFRTPKSPWTTPDTVAWNAAAPHLAIGSDGTAVVAWRAGAGARKIKASVRAPGGEFGDPVSLAKDRDIGIFGPVAAVGGGGRGIVAWSGRCPLYEPRERKRTRVVYLRRRAGVPEPAWSRVTQVENSKCPSSHLGAAMARDGRAILSISGSLHLWDGIRAAVRAPGQRFSPAELISRRGELANFAEVGMTREGRAIIAWSIYSDEGHSRGSRASIAEPEGDFSAPRRIATKGGIEDLAVTPGGDAVGVWHGLRSGRIKAAFMESDEWFGDPENVSPPLTTEMLAQPIVAINRRGRAVAAWGKPDRQGFARGVFVADRVR